MAVTDKMTFWNCLVAMRLKTQPKELLSTHDVLLYVHNQFVKHLEELKVVFKVC